MMAIDPHANQPVIAAGVKLEDAHAAMIMIHGRGAPAHDILGIAGEIDQGQVAYFAPQAAAYVWYPNRFIDPVEANEPFLASALNLVDQLVQHIVAGGIPHERIMLLGFSQGACLAIEYAARNARRYGGVAVLSGGLIGEHLTADTYGESMSGTPVFFGCSDVDFHIPKERVNESAEMLEKLGADVTLRLYPGMGHTINRDEIDIVRGMVAAVLADAPDSPNADAE